MYKDIERPASESQEKPLPYIYPGSNFQRLSPHTIYDKEGRPFVSESLIIRGIQALGRAARGRRLPEVPKQREPRIWTLQRRTAQYKENDAVGNQINGRRG